MKLYIIAFTFAFIAVAVLYTLAYLAVRLVADISFGEFVLVTGMCSLAITIVNFLAFRHLAAE